MKVSALQHISRHPHLPRGEFSGLLVARSINPPRRVVDRYGLRIESCAACARFSAPYNWRGLVRRPLPFGPFKARTRTHFTESFRRERSVTSTTRAGLLSLRSSTSG